MKRMQSLTSMLFRTGRRDSKTNASPSTHRVLGKERSKIMETRAAETEPDYEDMAPETRTEVNFSVEEKVRYLKALKALVFLPKTGRDGSFLTQVAEKVKSLGLNCTKQYASQCLYPDNPENLWKTRTPSYKAVWRTMTLMVEEALQQPGSRGYVAVMEALMRGRGVFITGMRSNRMGIIRNKCRDMGIAVTAHMEPNRLPYNYLLIPCKDRCQPAGLVTKKATTGLTRMIRHEWPTVDLVGFERGQVEAMGLGSSQRVGVKHYRITTSLS